MTTTNEHHNVVQLVERNQRKLRQLFRTKLLRCREELATAAAEHTAHNLPGADLLWQGVHEVEERLRTLFPAHWQTHYAEWVAADAARLHTAESPRPRDCRMCAERTTVAHRAS